jgi:hypothetical protein
MDEREIAAKSETRRSEAKAIKVTNLYERTAKDKSALSFADIKN